MPVNKEELKKKMQENARKARKARLKVKDEDFLNERTVQSSISIQKTLLDRAKFIFRTQYGLGFSAGIRMILTKFLNENE